MLRIACLLLVSLRCAAESLDKATSEIDKVKREIENDLSKDLNDTRKQIFNLLTAIGNETTIDGLYYGLEDGTLVGYNFAGSDFDTSLLDGWNCPFNYTGPPCFGVPCAAGMALQPACSKDYEVDPETGHPGECFDEAEVLNITDVCYYSDFVGNYSYDPRARPWYNSSRAAFEAGLPLTWSDTYPFSATDTPGVGLTATVPFTFGPDSPFAGVAGLDVRLTAIDKAIRNELGAIYYLVEPNGNLIATTIEGVALSEDGEGNVVQVAAADAQEPIIAESYAQFLDGGPGNFTFDGANYWFVNSTIRDGINLNWNLLGLHPKLDVEE
ncbi:hypothetical protein M885DRAFT_572978 [Pelagophyceae sp. CCMP2097]|nr:hypothetical protein M885DRAFT_572978 [Pelagophyceae sp. CCMP2097]